MKSQLLVFLLFSVFSSCSISLEKPALTVQDIDGNIYETVTIGDQVWMAENLNVSKWENGIENPYWIQSISGKLYYSKAFYEVLCPKGWHVSSKDDWEKLIRYLGGDLKTIGKQLKKSGIKGWNGTSKKNIGFNAVPNGIDFWENNTLKVIMQDSIAVFYAADYSLSYPILSTYTLKNNSDELMISSSPQIQLNNYVSSRFSCRCVKDN